MREGKGGTISAEPFKRLPSWTETYRYLPNGDLLLKCAYSDVVITAAGEIRAAP